jgi:hypothetical protein
MRNVEVKVDEINQFLLSQPVSPCDKACESLHLVPWFIPPPPSPPPPPPPPPQLRPFIGIILTITITSTTTTPQHSLRHTLPLTPPPWPYRVSSA